MRERAMAPDEATTAREAPAAAPAEPQTEIPGLLGGTDKRSARAAQHDYRARTGNFDD